MKNKILVIEVCERDIGAITECDTMEEAVEEANDLLRHHMKNIGHEDELESGEDEGSEWQRATEGNCNAWCNHHGNWDAHIVQF